VCVCVCRLVADLSEIESDRSPLRTRVSYVLLNTLGVKPGCLNIATLYMVRGYDV